MGIVLMFLSGGKMILRDIPSKEDLSKGVKSLPIDLQSFVHEMMDLDFNENWLVLFFYHKYHRKIIDLVSFEEERVRKNKPTQKENIVFFHKIIKKMTKHIKKELIDKKIYDWNKELLFSEISNILFQIDGIRIYDINWTFPGEKSSPTKSC